MFYFAQAIREGLHDFISETGFYFDVLHWDFSLE